MLNLENINAHYGKAHVLFHVSLSVNQCEIVSLLGANGAGKTTTLNVISGIVKPSSGTIKFLGADIQGLSPDEIVRKGICLCPEGRRIFSRMTVQENLEMGAYVCKKNKEVRSRLDETYIAFPTLKERRNQLAGTLSGGEQQMLAIVRSLMSRPRFVMLDEPSAGLAPLFITAIAEIISVIRKQGNTVVLVEQNAKLAMKLGDRAYVLENGKIILGGKTKDILEDEKIQKAYLGASNK